MQSSEYMCANIKACMKTMQSLFINISNQKNVFMNFRFDKLLRINNLKRNRLIYIYIYIYTIFIFNRIFLSKGKKRRSHDNHIYCMSKKSFIVYYYSLYKYGEDASEHTVKWCAICLRSLLFRISVWKWTRLQTTNSIVYDIGI